jgi:hypothetical protein
MDCKVAEKIHNIFGKAQKYFTKQAKAKVYVKIHLEIIIYLKKCLCIFVPETEFSVEATI